MYIIYNNDGSIYKKYLNEFIQQGNSYTNVLFVAIIGFDPSDYDLSAFVKLPDNVNIEMPTSDSTMTIDGTQYSGKSISLTSDGTLFGGRNQLNIIAENSSDNSVLVTFNIFFTVNETGLAADDPVVMTIAEYQSLVNDIEGYAKYQKISLNGTSGTLTNEQLSLLTDNVGTYVELDGYIYYQNEINSSDIVLINKTTDFARAITVDISDGSWAYSDYEYATQESFENYKEGLNQDFEDYKDDIDNEVDNIRNAVESVSGSPAGTYATLADLQTALPTGDNRIWLVTSNGHWYYWNGSAWTDGGLYLSSLPDNAFDENSSNAVQNSVITKAIMVKGNEFVLESGAIDGTTGAKVTNNTSCRTTTAMFFRKGTIISLLNNRGSRNSIYRIAKYSSEDISSGSFLNSYNKGQYNYMFEIPSDGYYAFHFLKLLNITMSADDITDILNNIDVKYLNNYEQEIVNVIKKDKELNFIFGYIDADGVFQSTPNTSSSSNYRNVISRRIGANEFTKLKITVKSGFQFLYVTFSDSAFISRSSWYNTTGQEVEISNDYDVFLVVASSQVTTEVVSDAKYISCGVDIEFVNDDTYLSDITKIDNTKFLSKVTGVNFEGKNVHLSFDDVWHLLYALQTETHASIFEIPVLSWLQTLHNTYGIKVTLNCFVENLAVTPNYSMASIPNTFASEFQANANWLRIAFHGKNLSSDYSFSKSTLKDDYEEFVTNVESFAGGNNCIDTVPRLGYFAGSKKQIEDIANVDDSPIIGLLAADDDRISYYLDSEDNNLLKNKFILFDAKQKITFFRTMTRLDTDQVSNIEQTIENNAHSRKYVEIFCHITSTDLESSRKQYIESLLNYLITNNGYESNFLMDIFK